MRQAEQEAYSSSELQSRVLALAWSGWPTVLGGGCVRACVLGLKLHRRALGCLQAGLTRLQLAAGGGREGGVVHAGDPNVGRTQVEAQRPCSYSCAQHQLGQLVRGQVVKSAQATAPRQAGDAGGTDWRTAASSPGRRCLSARPHTRALQSAAGV